MERRMVLEVAGLICDATTKSIFALGRLLPVTAVSYSEATTARPGSDRAATPQGRFALEIVYGTPEKIAEAMERPIPATAESLHFNLLCENGWWLEVAAWPEDDSLSWMLPGETIDYECHGDAADLLRAYDEVAQRPALDPSTLDEYSRDPWCGIKPGSWLDTPDFGPLDVPE